MGTTVKGEKLSLTSTPLIFSKIPKIMGLVGVVGKDRTNIGQGYKFRGIDDMYNALNEHLSKEKVFVICTDITDEHTSERQSAKGGVIFDYRAKFTWSIVAEDGSFIKTTTIGKGMDSGDKDANKAMSTAYKYALMQTFCIPTDEPKDSENDDHDVKPLVENTQKSTPSTPKTNANSYVKETPARYEKVGKPILWNDILWQLTKALRADGSIIYERYFDTNPNQADRAKSVLVEVMESNLRNAEQENEQVVITNEMDREISKD